MSHKELVNNNRNIETTEKCFTFFVLWVLYTFEKRCAISASGAIVATILGNIILFMYNCIMCAPCFG